MAQEFGTTDGAANLNFDRLPAEGPSVDGEPVTAFVGPAPRGPVDRAVAITDIAAFDRLYGVPGYHCRLRMALLQFFANGGRNAVVVRVTTATGRSRIVLPTDAGPLVLEALNPGPLECLRASVDYDGLLPDNTDAFNLVVQRLRQPGSAWIEEQECFRRVSIDPTCRDFLGKVLTHSALVRLAGVCPTARPLSVIRPGTLREAGYVNAVAAAADTPPPGDYDLIGSATAGTGLSALAGIRDIAHLCLLPGSAAAVVGPVALLAADRFCRERQALLIMDPPAHWRTPADALRDPLQGCFVSPNAVTWFPPVLAQSSGGDWAPATATGALAAALAGEQRARGIDSLHAEPLIMLRGGLRPAAEPAPEDRRRLMRAGINTLTRRSALHLQLQARVTRARHANPVAGSDDLELRADILFLTRRIRLGTRWVAGRDNDARLHRELQGQLERMLRAAADAGLLVSRLAGHGYVVRVEAVAASPTPVCFTVGLAVRAPGAFLGYRFLQAPAGCDVLELGWLATPEMAVAN